MKQSLWNEGVMNLIKHKPTNNWKKKHVSVYNLQLNFTLISSISKKVLYFSKQVDCQWLCKNCFDDESNLSTIFFGKLFFGI